MKNYNEDDEQFYISVLQLVFISLLVFLFFIVCFVVNGQTYGVL